MTHLQGPDIIDLAAYRARGLAASRSPQMVALRELVDRVAPGMINVLILGETGAGKEVLAEAVHRASRRAARPLLRLNCAALSETLLESELFGHERGAFTGAVQSKRGLLETAEGGSVFLDEIGELPMSIQVKLLRVLEERAVLPVGGLRARPIDVRFIAATNRDLAVEVARGRFREDLYFRIDGVTLPLPPLRERKDEITALARAFVAATWATLDRDDAPPELSAATLERLYAHPWPGNIRELRNVMERAALLCSGATIQPADIVVTEPRRGRTPSQELAAAVSPAATPPSAPLPIRRDTAPARPAIIAALALCGNNQTLTAKHLGVSRATLIAWLDRFDIDRPRRRARLP